MFFPNTYFQKLVFHLTFLLALCSFFALEAKAAELELIQDSRKRIVFLGDSLTAGYGLPEESSYPSLLQKKLGSMNYHYKVSNAGVSGDTSAGGLRRLSWLMKKPVAVLVVALGANDGLRGLDPVRAKENIREIVIRARKKMPSIKILLAGILAPPSMGARYAKEFKGIFPEIAEKESVAFMPFLLEGVAADPELNLADGIHPNAAGQKIIAENLWKYLEPLLEK